MSAVESFRLLHARRQAALRRACPFRRLCAAVLLLVVVLMLLPLAAFAEVPREANAWRRHLTRSAVSVWGVTAPIAAFAAQIEQESDWNPAAKSTAGAQGMAQFMPTTAAWIDDIYPELGAAKPLDPRWAITALVQYDRWLWERLADTANDCERFAFVLAGYNGGLGWVHKARRRAADATLDARRWFTVVELINPGRADWAQTENRRYPARILHVLEVRYLAAGWRPGICH